MVRSCPLLQHIARTRANDTSIRCRGPKIMPGAVWKTNMRGRIQLTFFQLSV